MELSTFRRLTLAGIFILSLIFALFIAVFIPTGAHVHAATQETLTIPFVNGQNGATTTNSYIGSVTITISGYGQEAGTKYSDAFYLFTDDAGNPVTPYHLYGFGLWINYQPVENYVTAIPSYSSDHTYQFKISLSGDPQPITFGIGDTYTVDNSGSFSVTVMPSIQQIDNANWAGYALESTLSHSQFLDVIGSWTVPKANCNFLEISRSAFWVALGSLNPAPAPLEQIGTMSECRAGVPFYDLVYQMLPAQQNATQVPFKLIFANDPITAEVKYSPPNSFTLSIQDAAPHRGWSYSKTFTQTQMTGALSTAIWAAEAVKSYSLTNFGTVNFSGCTTDRLRISDGFIIDKLVLEGSSGTRAAPFDLNPDGMSFSVQRLNP
jgi:hypothetical protein